MEEPLSSAPDVVGPSKLTSCGGGDVPQGRLQQGDRQWCAHAWSPVAA